jgi:hypothetical protein
MNRARCWFRYNAKGEKRCAECGRFLPVSDFYTKKITADRLQQNCKDCENFRGLYYAHCGLARQLGSPPLAREIFQMLIGRPCVWGGGMRPEIHIGIDRIDSTQGYSVLNAQPCCPRHNNLKGAIHDAAFRIHLANRPGDRKCGNQQKGSKRAQQPGPPVSAPASPASLTLPLFDEEPTMQEVMQEIIRKLETK